MKMMMVPIIVTLVGIVTAVRFVHDTKASSKMLVYPAKAQSSSSRVSIKSCDDNDCVDDYVDNYDSRLSYG